MRETERPHGRPEQVEHVDGRPDFIRVYVDSSFLAPLLNSLLRYTFFLILFKKISTQIQTRCIARRGEPRRRFAPDFETKLSSESVLLLGSHNGTQNECWNLLLGSDISCARLTPASLASRFENHDISDAVSRNKHTNFNKSTAHTVFAFGLEQQQLPSSLVASSSILSHADNHERQRQRQLRPQPRRLRYLLRAVRDQHDLFHQRALPQHVLSPRHVHAMRHSARVRLQPHHLSLLSRARSLLGG